MTGRIPPPSDRKAVDSPLYVLAGGLLEAERRRDAVAVARTERERAADLARLAATQAETEALFERLAENGLRIVFALSDRGCGASVTLRDLRGHTVRRLDPSTVTDLARLRALVETR